MKNPKIGELEVGTKFVKAKSNERIYIVEKYINEDDLVIARDNLGWAEAFDKNDEVILT